MTGHGRPRRSAPIRLLLVALALAACQAPTAGAPAPARAEPPAPATAPTAGAPAVSAATGTPSAPAWITARLPEKTHVIYGGPSGALWAVGIALERGYFADVNLDLDIEEVTNSAQIAPSLTTGQIDVGHSAASPAVFNALLRRLPIKAILDISHYSPTGKSHLIVVRQDLYDSGELNRLEQLKGRRVAANGGLGATSIDVDRALKPLGLSIDDVDQVAIPFPEQPTALANRSVDGAITVEPYGSRAVEVGPGRVLRYLNEDYPNHQVSFALISNRLMEHPEIARAFAVGFLRGVRDYERARQYGEDVDGVIADIVKHNRVPPELLQALFRNGANTAMDPDGKLNVASLDYDLNWYRDHGAIQGELTTADFVDAQYAAYAARLLGPFGKN
ncbi:MAG TPA: ABC transporter substrate-binding protein [Chloroflexota bacterium]|nr:ABC transporter substrate-binding protein [Chloroflexota bacterium]